MKDELSIEQQAEWLLTWLRDSGAKDLTDPACLSGVLMALGIAYEAGREDAPGKRLFLTDIDALHGQQLWREIGEYLRHQASADRKKFPDGDVRMSSFSYAAKGKNHSPSIAPQCSGSDMQILNAEKSNYERRAKCPFCWREIRINPRGKFQPHNAHPHVLNLRGLRPRVVTG